MTMDEQTDAGCRHMHPAHLSGHSPVAPASLTTHPPLPLPRHSPNELEPCTVACQFPLRLGMSAAHHRLWHHQSVGYPPHVGCEEMA
jgi:hypothetical protein